MGFLKDHNFHYFSDLDHRLIYEESESLPILMDAFLQEFDNLNELGPDKLPDLVSVNDIPEELLNHLSTVVGWRQTDYEFNFQTYRDVVRNIVRTYKIKGTQLSYETFFRSFGYIPTVHELWWDRFGNLQRTKPTGAPNPGLPTNRLNKSNFIEIEFDLILNDPAIPNPFNSGGDFLRIVFEYLLFLKPVHIRYKPIIVKIPSFAETVVTVEDLIPIIIVGDQASPLGIGVDGLFEEHLPGNTVPTDDMRIFAFADEKEKIPMKYNNTIRYGQSVARIVEINNIVFPVSVIQRDAVLFGGQSPIPDTLNIVVQASHFVGEEKLQLRFNNYVNFTNTTVFQADQTIEIKDGIDYDSAEIFSFGPGTLWDV